MTEFHRHKRDGYQAWCKPCRAEYAAAHYQRNKARRQAQNNRRQAEVRAWYADLKRKPCTDCGLQFHPAAMQWDHLPGYEKTAALGQLIRQGSYERVLEEIEKCELVCANCHAIRSYMRAQNPREDRKAA